MRRIGPHIGARTAILLALVLGGGAVTAGVTLPEQASDRAHEATADVATGNTSQVGTQSNGGFVQGLPEEASITGDINSAFGQCVANQAQTENPNESHPGFNPTDACQGLRNQPGVEGQGQGEGPDHATGLDRAEDRSGGNAGGQGPSASTQGGGNGPSSANAHGADNASARGDNANK